MSTELIKLELIAVSQIFNYKTPTYTLVKQPMENIIQELYSQTYSQERLIQLKAVRLDTCLNTKISYAQEMELPIILQKVSIRKELNLLIQSPIWLGSKHRSVIFSRDSRSVTHWVEGQDQAFQAYSSTNFGNNTKIK